MLTWLSFLNVCLFFCLSGCVCASGSFFQLLLTAELTWIFLYTIAGVIGTFIDEAGIFSLTFFNLGFAAMELCFGLLIILLMRHLNLSLFLEQNHKKTSSQLFRFFTRLSSSKNSI